MRVTVLAVRSPALLALVASCTEAAPPPEPPPPHHVYEPAPVVWQLGPLVGRFGRGQTPQPASRELGVAGELAPLRDPVPWPVPGREGRAIVYGRDGDRPALELIDVETGVLTWRRHDACVEPIVQVTDAVVACGGARGVRVVGLDGKPRWATELPLRAVTGPWIVAGAPDAQAVSVFSLAGGEQRVELPAEIAASAVVGSCGADEVYAYVADQLLRIAKLRDKAAVTWRAPFVAPPPVVPPPLRPRLPRAPAPPPPPPRPSTLELEALACGDTLIAATRPVATPQVVPVERPRALRAIARATGKHTGVVEHVRAWWPDGDDLVIATTSAVQRWPRALDAPGGMLAVPLLGELLDQRGTRRLVRATPSTVVELDGDRVIRYLPIAASRAVLGRSAVLWASAGGLRSRRLPEAPPARATRIPPRRAGVTLPAELRDLPEVAELANAPIAGPELAARSVGAIALDPREPEILYAAAVGDASSTVARADLAAGRWTWQRDAGCATGAVVGLALARGIVACATATSVRATTRDGAAAWERTLDRIDAVAAAGSVVLAWGGDRLTVLDAATGLIRGRLASPDGARVRAAAVTTPIAERPGDDQTWLVAFERDRLVARIPEISMIAVWSLAVDGTIAELAPSGAGVLVSLDDGDAYRVELATAAVTPLPGLGLVWRATGELVTGEAVGGPIPGVPGPPPPRPVVRPAFGRPPAPSDRNVEAPDLWIPIPEPKPLGDSWQLTLYERAGGLRARNDYGLAPPVMAATTRGPAGSPLVVVSGATQRDVLVLDPQTGDPLRRITLPGAGLVFGTTVRGAPVAGTVLAAPLRIVLF